MNLNDPVRVYSLNDPIKAEIMKNALQAEGIHCFLEGINQASTVGLVPFEIHINVEAADADRASRFIHQHEEGRHKAKTWEEE